MRLVRHCLGYPQSTMLIRLFDFKSGKGLEDEVVVEDIEGTGSESDLLMGKEE